MIITACFLIGNDIANKLTKRVNELKLLKIAVLKTESDLRYRNDNSSEMMRRIFSSEGFSKSLLFAACRKQAEKNDDFSQAVSKALYETTGYLKKNDISILKDFSCIVGKADIKSQITRFDQIKQELDESIASAKEQADKMCRLYRIGSMMFGIAIAITLV